MDVYYQTVKPDVNTFWCFTYRYLMNDNTGMDITSTRRARLRHLIDTDYAGSQAAFVERTGINQGELSGLLRKKSFGEKRARSLEVAAGLPSMYLDNPGPDAPTLQHAQRSEKIEPLVGSLTREQQQMLLLIENMDPETRKAWLKISASLAKSSKSVVTESDQSPTANAVDIKEAQPIESKPMPPLVQTREKDSAFRQFKAPELLKVPGSSRGDGKKIEKKEGKK